MRSLIRLYPRRWRERYEAEILDLLAERPASIADGLDLVRGAFDAHLHPQAHGSRPAAQPLTHRIPGVLALAAGLLWTANVTWLVVRRDPAEGWGSLIGTAFVLMLICLPGDYMLAGHGRRIAIGLAVSAACFAGLAAIPWWPVGLALAVVGYLVVLGGTLALAALRAGIGSSGRWRLVTLALALPVLIASPFAIGVIETSSSLPVVQTLFIPYGLAWLLIGWLMAIRGAPTIADIPPAMTQPHPLDLEGSA